MIMDFVGCGGTWWDVAIGSCWGWLDVVVVLRDVVGPDHGFILVVSGMWLWVWQDVVGCIHEPAADVAVAAP